MCWLCLCTPDAAAAKVVATTADAVMSAAQGIASLTGMLSVLPL